MGAPKGTDEHSKRLRLTWLKRTRLRGRSRRPIGDETVPMSHRDLWKKIKRETKGKPPGEELRILEEYLADWPEFKGPYQEMRKKYERRMGELRRVLSVRSSHSEHGDPFSVRKRGLAEIALVGLPNSGKSSLMNALTGADVKVADYPYTTLTPNVAMWNPGAFGFEVIDLPPVPEASLGDVHYASGLKEAILNADLLCLVVSLESDLAAEVRALRDRLREVGVTPVFTPARVGGSGRLPSEAPLSDRGAVVVGTRIDTAGLEKLETLSDLLPGASVFGHPMDPSGSDDLSSALCGFLHRIVVVARDPRSKDEPLRYAVPAGATVFDLAKHIHNELADTAARAKVWGGSARFPGQEVGLDHTLTTGDVVEIYSR